MENQVNVENGKYVSPVESVSSDDVKSNINAAREEFLKVHVKISRVNKIISGVFFIVAIAFVILGNTFSKLLGLSFGIIIASLVVVLIITKKQRKLIDDAVAKYLYVYSLYCNSYMYDESIQDLQIGYKEKPDLEDIKKISISDEITVVNSRDLVKGKYEGKQFSCADVSLKTGNPKKERSQKALFVGKIYMLDYSFKDEGRTLLYLKGCGDATPTKLADVNQVKVEGLKKDWEVYTSHADFEKIFNTSLIKALNKIHCDETLNDVVVSFVKDKVIIGFSYSDPAMIIPMNKDFETNHLEIKKDNFNSFKEINKALLENSEFTK